MKREICLIDIVVCFFLALGISAAPYYINTGACHFYLSFVLTAFAEFFVLVLAFTVARKTISCYLQYALRRNDNTVIDRIMAKKSSVLVASGIILLFWIPVLIALYPGTMINDSWGQLQQYIRFLNGENALYDHHPVVVTMIMGRIIMTAQKFTGSLTRAFFIYVFIQAVFTSLAFSASIVYAHVRLRIGNGAVLCMLFVYCLLPVFPASVQTISKDAFSAWLFVFYMLLFTEGVRTKGEVFSNILFIILLTVLGLLCALTKKVNTYVVLFSLLAMFVFVRNKRIWLIIPILTISVSMLVLMPAFLKAHDIRLGGKQEMLSIPYQQTARYVKEHPDDITEDEYQVVDKLLDMSDLAERYNALNADPVKGYHERGTKKEYIDYLKVWLAQGIRHPCCYFDAFNAMIAGWFSSTEYVPLMTMDWHSQLDTSLIPEYNAKRFGFFSYTAKNYQQFYDNLYENPLLKFFFSYNTFAVIIPAFVFTTVTSVGKQSKNRYWLVVVPVIFSLLLGCFLAPVSIHFEGRRYLYPLTYTTPLMLAFCIYTYKESRKCYSAKREIIP